MSVASYNTGDDATIAGYWATYLAQSFTAAGSEVPDEMRVKVSRTGSPGTITLSLYDANGSGEPGGYYGDVSFDGNGATTDSNGGWITVDISTWALASFVSGTKYVVVMHLGGSISNCINWRVDSSAAAYAGGERLHSINIGATWTHYATHDFIFEINGGYVFVPPSGSATTRRLVGAAASAFWYEEV